ncbi:hypothetical protein HYV82_04585 [Candidatus Woesearchaeota archaeon]|nr:hypothetical protein [Candidatus Woesearchaeota archaeon]
MHQRIIARFGKKRVSEGVNELLFRELVKAGRKDMFGADKGSKPFVREHHDRF